MSLGAEAPVIILVLGMVVALAALVLGLASTEKAKKSWKEIAQRLGLQLEEDFKMTGTIGRQWAEASVYTKGHGKNRRTYTRIRVKGGMPKDIRLAREGFWSMVVGGDIPTGDKGFDAQVKVEGNAARVQALLDPAMREALIEPIRDGWRLDEGYLIYEVQRRLASELEGRIQAGVALADAVREAVGDIPSRLAGRLASEPEAAARRTVFKILDAEYKHTPAYPKGIALALADSDAELRLMAAVSAGDVGVLSALAVDASVGDRFRADALWNLSERHADAVELVRAVEVLRAEHAASGGLPSALMVALCAAHTKVGREDTEAFLVNALEVDAEDVKVAAIEALGRVGTVHAVPALTVLRDKAFASVRRVPSAAKDAILAIQSRIAGAGAGSLALAEGAGAELALVARDGEAPVEASVAGERRPEVETAD